MRKAHSGGKPHARSHRAIMETRNAAVRQAHEVLWLLSGSAARPQWTGVYDAWQKIYTDGRRHSVCTQRLRQKPAKIKWVSAMPVIAVGRFANGAATDLKKAAQMIDGWRARPGVLARNAAAPRCSARRSAGRKPFAAALFSFQSKADGA